ncbi:MAG: tetratricopeptide repeat protein [Burkholderiaceae bacterium]|jgi:tetratricopeptide (TPR) repeat protein|nr:tetratricopeptide repeat protein [Burkholderiaceae bacterium]
MNETPSRHRVERRTPAVATRATHLLMPLIALTIVGCATTSPAPSTAPTPAASSQPAPAPSDPAATGRAAGGDAIPDVNVSGRLLYQLMAAEVALQQGDAAAAYAAYLAVARQTRDPRLARRATEIAVGARATGEALAAATLWRELAPQSSEALQTTAVLLVSAARYDEAAALFQQQLRQSAQPLEELQRTQRILARAPDRAAALELLTRVAAPYRNDPKIGADVLLVLAGGAHAAGQSQRAIDDARAALVQRPDFERAALIAAQLMARPDGNDDPKGRAQAAEMLAEFLARNPKAQDARLTYARLLVADGKYEAARREFAQTLAQDESNLDALYALGVLSLDRPALRADARRFFERYVALVSQAPASAPARDPDPAFLNLARLAEDERKYSEAIGWLDRIDGGEQYLAARQRKALVLGKMKRVDEGRRLLADTPTESEAERQQLLLTEGQLLREAGRHKEALGLLEGALKTTPDDTALLYDAALIAEKLDRTELMETYLRRAMKLKPDEAHAFNALGYSLADRNTRLQEAYELIAHALKLSPDDAFIQDSMGWVYFRMGNLAKAREYLSRAWSARPHAEVGAHYGEALWVLGERDKARAIWRESQAIEPDNETLQSTLKRLQVRL